MSNTKLFVGNLSYGLTDDALRDVFSKCGKIVEASIVRRGNRSQGFGFVEFESESGAKAAIEKYNQSNVDGREINVQFSRPRSSQGYASDDEDDSRSPDGRRNNFRRGGGNFRRGGFRGGYGGGGYGGGGYGRGGFGGGGFGGGGYVSGGFGGGSFGGGSRGYSRGRGGGFRRFGRRGFGRGGFGGFGRGGFGGRGGYGFRRGGRGFGGFGRGGFGRRAPNMQREPSKTMLAVYNLPYSFKDEDLLSLFNKENSCGGKSARIVLFRGRSKGFGFVEFENQESQVKALKQMDNFKVKGDNGEREISVKIAYN